MEARGDNQSKRMRINLYITQKRAELFNKAFSLLQERGMMPQSAKLERSRAAVVDMALDSLIRELDDK